MIRSISNEVVLLDAEPEAEILEIAFQEMLAYSIPECCVFYPWQGGGADFIATIQLGVACLYQLEGHGFGKASAQTYKSVSGLVKRILKDNKAFNQSGIFQIRLPGPEQA